jgi:hypothetical protein
MSVRTFYKNTMLGFAGGVGTSGVAAAEIINSGTKTARIRKITLFLKAATASTYGVGFPAAAGVTPTSPVAFLCPDQDYTGLVKKAIAWATPPTVPAAMLMTQDAPATIGYKVEFDFGEPGLVLTAGQTLVVWNSGTNSIVNLTVEAREDVSAVVSES